jgi:prepilin signal peptidase PulO-like enzyme (type II secretory pathway)
MERSLAFVARYGDATLLARALLVVAWQVTGWWIVVACFRRRPAAAGQPAGAPDAASRRAVTWS